MLNTVKIILEDGTSYETSVSAQSTKESCEAYFVGQMIDVGIYPNEKLVRCVGIEYAQASI